MDQEGFLTGRNIEVEWDISKRRKQQEHIDCDVVNNFMEIPLFPNRKYIQNCCSPWYLYEVAALLFDDVDPFEKLHMNPKHFSLAFIRSFSRNKNNR